MTVRVVIVRHGESTFNIDRRVQGRSDHSVLTGRGLEQATCVRKVVAGTPFRHAYCSPLTRAHQTAAQIVTERSPEVPLETTPLLQEVNLSAWAGMTFADIEVKDPDRYALWRNAPDQMEMDGSYPILDLWHQAKDFWAFLQSQQPDLVTRQSEDPVVDLLLVGHSGINRALISTALGLVPAHYQRIGQDNCAISILNFHRGLAQCPQLESLNVTAHLGNPLPSRKTGLRLLLVRHGETQWNREQRFQGQMDIPLNETGVDQAKQVAAFLADSPFTIAFSSPLKRPWDTAAAICEYVCPDGKAAHPDLQLQPIPELQEISHGLWEGKLQSEIEAEFPGQLEQWQLKPETVQMPEGENLQQVWDRTRTAWAELVKAAEAASPDALGLVVAHDAINKAAISQVFDLDPAAFWCFKQGNGAVTVFDYPQGSSGYPVLRAANLTAHMDGGIFDCTAAGAL